MEYLGTRIVLIAFKRGRILGIHKTVLLVTKRITLLDQLFNGMPLNLRSH
jgi:hypothetical protein